MADRTKIEWADSTWNPVVGCERVSPGCAHCYAESFARRQGVSSSYEPGKATIRCFPERLGIPGRWRKPRRVFVCSLADLFHEAVPDEFIGRVFAMMAEAHWHTFMILTKRADRMEDWSRGVSHYPQGDRGQRVVAGWPPNVEAGVSVENQHWADLRIPLLAQTPAAHRFLSLEPLLGTVDLGRWLNPMEWGHETGGPQGWQPDPPPLGRVIVGGESGHRARPMNPDHPRMVRDACLAAGVEFVFKQWGAHIPESQVGTCRHCGATAHWARAHRRVEHSGLVSYRVGKKAAGATLDGQLWSLQRPDGV